MKGLLHPEGPTAPLPRGPETPRPGPSGIVHLRGDRVALGDVLLPEKGPEAPLPRTPEPRILRDSRPPQAQCLSCEGWFSFTTREAPDVCSSCAAAAPPLAAPIIGAVEPTPPEATPSQEGAPLDRVPRWGGEIFLRITREPSPMTATPTPEFGAVDGTPLPEAA